jgi:hypothetical protein
MPQWLYDALTAPRTVTVARPSVRVARSVGDAYARAALDGELDRVRAAPVGSRNETLCRAAFSLGQLVASGTLARDHAIGALLDAAHASGLGETESVRTVASGMRAGFERPRRR